MTAPPPALLRPAALRPGDTVAVVAPSWHGPATLPGAYRRGLAALAAEGFTVRPMPNAGAAHRWTAGTAQQRADDLHQAFADPSVRGIVCAIGGDHAAQLLPLLDFGLIAANPKVFCGYSDATVLHQAIHARTGLVTIYGPALIPQWGAVGGPLHYVLDHFHDVTGRAQPAGPLPRATTEVHDTDFDTAEREGRPLRQSPARPRAVLRAGTAAGPLLAACLPSARHLLGTPWQPDYRGRVLVLETPEPPYGPAEADRDLTHLRLAGCLDRLAALVLCRPYAWSDGDRVLLHQLALEHTAPHGYPVLANVEGGHTDPLPSLPIGVATRVDEDRLTFTEAAVRIHDERPPRPFPTL